MTAVDWSSVRREFPAAERAAYLDNAAASLVPRVAQEAMAAYYAGIPFNTQVQLSPTVSYGAVGEEAAAVTAAVAAGRATVARAVGASARDVAFTKNATEALNLLAQGLPWEAQDEILLSEVEHQSGLLPWVRLAAERGLRLTWVPADASGLIDPADVERRITTRTRLVVMIHVASLLGTIEPAEAVGAIAARHGVAFAVDAAQAAGRVPVDVMRIGCDFLVVSGRKALLGPHGIAALVGRAGSLRRLRPMNLGSRAATVRELPDGGVEYDLADSPFHLEAGAVNAGGVIGLAASVGFLEALGWPKVFARIRNLAEAQWEAVAAVSGVQIYGSSGHSARTGIVSFNIHGRDSYEVCEALWRLQRVVTSPGIHGSPLAVRKLSAAGTVRASVHCFNSQDDIERLARGLKAVAASGRAAAPTPPSPASITAGAAGLLRGRANS